jgi:hypothetical protein
MTVFEQLKSSLLATFQSVENAQRNFQTNIEESITRLHAVPLDERLADRLVKATDKVLSLTNVNLQQVSLEFSRLEKAARSIMMAVKNMNQIFAGRFFKFGYQTLISVGITAAISLISIAIYGVSKLL